MDYKKYNLEVASDLERLWRHPVSDEKYWGTDNARVFRCVECGDWLPSTIVYFYKGRVDQCLCYECQNKKRGIK